MRLKEAINNLLEDEELGEVLKDMVLMGASTFTDDNEKIEMWEINFYNPEKENIVRVILEDNNTYEMLEGEFANPKDKEKFKGFMSKGEGIVVEEEKALDIARKEYFEKYDMKIDRILIIYNAYDNTWTINLLSATSLKVIQIIIDATTGEVKESKEVEIGKRM